MAINTQKFLPSSKKEAATENFNVKKSSISLSQNSVKNISTIKVKVIQIESILKGTLASEKKALDQKKRKESAVRREKQEEKLETKPNAERGQFKMPQSPKLGIFEWVKNFIGNIILGYFAVRLVEHLPKIMPIVKLLGKAADLMIDFGGKFLNGLATFVDWGYKAVDFSRGLVGKTFGDDALKNFDKLTSEFEKFMNLAIIVGMASADFGMDRMRRPGPTGPTGTTRGGTRTRTGGAPIGGPDIRNPLRRRPTVTQGRGGTKLASKFGSKVLKAVPFLGAGLAIVEGIMRIREGDYVGGLLSFGTAIPVAGWAFLALDIAREFMGGSEFDKSVGRALGGKSGLTNKQVQKRTPHMSGPSIVTGLANGGMTRGGKSQGRARRTIGRGRRGKYKRALAPTKPGKIEIKTDTDVGQRDKVFDFFGFIKGAIDTINPFNTIKKSGEELGKTDYFGPILAITSKLTLGQELTQQDYRNVGLGINMLISKGIQEKQLKGGVVAAFAEGGLVDPDVISAAQTGGDISNWVAKTFRGEIESNSQRTLRMIKENAEKKKKESTETPPSPDIEIGGVATSGGGTADVSLNPYRRSFLDTLAYAEGTANYPNTGYNTMFTGKQFVGYKDHPRKIQVSGRYRSDAAGRYQFLSTTWDGLGLPDFSPANQDRGALKLLAPHVLTAIDKGDFATAFHGARKTWASLPGAGYGQPEKKMKTLVGYANSRLEKYRKGQIGKPVDEPLTSLPSSVKSGSMRTGPSEYIGGSTAYHIDTKFHKSLGMGAMVSAMDKLANAYSARGRKIEFSNAGVSGAVWNPSASSQEKRSLLQRAIDAHSHSRFMRAEGFLPIDYYNPKKNDTRFGKSVEGSEILLPTFGGKVDVGTKYGGYGKSAEIYSGNKMVAMTGHGDVRYEKGGPTLDRAHLAIVGEKGREYVIDADSTNAVEKTFPGFLGALNQAKYTDAINVLRNFASYEFGSNQTVIVMNNASINNADGGQGDSSVAVVMGGSGGDTSDPFESLVMGG